MLSVGVAVVMLRGPALPNSIARTRAAHRSPADRRITSVRVGGAANGGAGDETLQALQASAASSTTAAPAPARVLDLTGHVEFPYLVGLGVAQPTVVARITLTGFCNAVAECDISLPYTGPPFEGAPSHVTLQPNGRGYSTSVRFDHSVPGPPCAPIPISLSLDVVVAEGADGWGIAGTGTFLPDRRSSALPDGSPGCQTDVATFAFATAGLDVPPQPSPPPPPPG